MSDSFHNPITPCDWKVIASFTVYGIAKAQPRVKFSAHGKFGKAYTPDGPHKVWEELLYLQAKQHVPKDTFDGPVRVWITWFFPRPKEFEKPCYPDGPFEMIQKPDRDNAEKKILDVFTNLGFFKDDKQVCGGEPSKYYVERGGKPRMHVSVEINQCWPYKKTRAGRSKTASLPGSTGDTPHVQSTRKEA